MRAAFQALRGAACAALLAPAVVMAQVPFVPTPTKVVEAMLDIAKVGPGDFVIDLGSGDGRIVITAARRHGARGFGVDLDGALVSDAQREAARQGVADKVQFHERNIFVTDLHEATVVTAYLFPQLLTQLRPRLFEQLKPGTRVVSHEFDFENWKPDAKTRVSVPDKPYGPPSSDVYLWVVPANAAGRWQWRLPTAAGPLEYEATLEQIFQELRGSARIAGKPARIEYARLRGADIVIAIAGEAQGREVRHELAGRITGDTIRGKTRFPGSATELDWQATRTSRGKINIDAAGALPALAANNYQ